MITGEKLAPTHKATAHGRIKEMKEMAAPAETLTKASVRFRAVSKNKQYPLNKR